MAGRKLLFLHIPKVAGNSLLEIILPNFSGAECFNVNDGLDYVQRLQKLASLPAQQADALRLVFGHLPFGVHATLPGEWKYFTVLRDPVDRVASHYFFVKEQPKHYLHQIVMERQLTLEEYVSEGLSGELNNGMTRLLCGRPEIDSLRGHGECTERHFDEACQNLVQHFSVCGILEDLDRTQQLICRVFDWPLRSAGQRNRTKARVGLDRIPQAAVEAIRHYNQLDMRLYDLARNRFEQSCEEHQIKYSSSSIAARAVSLLRGVFDRC